MFICCPLGTFKDGRLWLDMRFVHPLTRKVPSESHIRAQRVSCILPICAIRVWSYRQCWSGYLAVVDVTAQRFSQATRQTATKYVKDGHQQPRVNLLVFVSTWELRNKRILSFVAYRFHYEHRYIDHAWWYGVSKDHEVYVTERHAPVMALTNKPTTVATVMANVPSHK